MKSSIHFVKCSCPNKILEKVVKVTVKEINRKLKVTLKVLGSVAYKYLDTKVYIEENLKKKT